ncbi:Histidine N-alpha-methyltransferase [Arenibacter antarcticus]|uniref:L-histidine N(Alpha)-methyltransferase n=1 Tax=Arenibacter antarcticus TaxID=2040469 RepID=A0ABW5VFH3_9FLAO|nr:L-histidine N(alpha)-methyltransferase [Arenibacter sp. H213]MCM4169477.1 L-histidine N(alpha)-methyltransferase [Arenibacter sp. H213]
MEQNTISKTQAQFAQDVKDGLMASPKHLSSKYIYNQKGDMLFERIMELSEYYLTECEFDILNKNKEQITALFLQNAASLNLVELGAGNGKKTKIILKQLLKTNREFRYVPIDISDNALAKLKNSLSLEFPNIKVIPKQGTYFNMLETIESSETIKNVILFLGSNIGNLTRDQAIIFLAKLAKGMHGNDMIFIGCDQKKNPQTILNAYNDPHGVTEAFNKNLLERINKDLNANFNLDNFIHWEVYDPESGTAKSYLVSKTAQRVTIESLDLEIDFKAWETIHTEISQKYDDAHIADLAQAAGLRILTQFSDDKNYFKNYILIKK